MATGSPQTPYRGRGRHDSHGHTVPRAPARRAGTLKPRRRWHNALRSAPRERTGRMASVTLKTTDGGRRRHDQNGSTVGSINKIAACNLQQGRRWHNLGGSPSQGHLRRTGKRALCSNGDFRYWSDDIQVAKAYARRLTS